jgi:hypothetical protein
MDDLGFLAKVLMLSGLITAVIKFIAPLWPLSETLALSIVLLPTVLIGGWLVWQQQRG